MEREVNHQVVYRMVDDVLSNPKISSWLTSPEPIPTLSLETRWMQHCLAVERSVLVDSGITAAQLFTKPQTTTEQLRQQSSTDFDRPEKLELICHNILDNIAYITMVDTRVPLSFLTKQRQQSPAQLSSNIQRAVAEYKDDQLYFSAIYHLQDGGAVLVVKVYSMYPVISSHQYMVALSRLSSSNAASHILGFALLKEYDACETCLNQGRLNCTCPFHIRMQRGQMPKLGPPPQVVYGDLWHQLAWYLCKYDSDLKKYQVYIHGGETQAGCIHQQTCCIYDGPCGDFVSKDFAYFVGSMSTHQQELAKIGLVRSLLAPQADANPAGDAPTPRSTERLNRDEFARGGYVRVKSEHGMTSIPKSMKALLNFDSGQLADGTQVLLTTSDTRLPLKAPRTDIQEKKSELDPSSTPSSKTKKERGVHNPAAASPEISVSRRSHGGEDKSDSDESSFSESSHPDDKERNHILRIIRELDREKWTGGNCKMCSQPFSRKHDLKRHIKTIHLSERSFKCSNCESRFKRRQHLESHVKTVHEKSCSFVCERCGKVFTADSTRRRHVRTIHGGDSAGPSGSWVEREASPRIAVPSDQSPAKYDAGSPKQEVVVSIGTVDLASQVPPCRHFDDIAEHQDPHAHAHAHPHPHQNQNQNQPLSQDPSRHPVIMSSDNSPYHPLPSYNPSKQSASRAAWYPSSDAFHPSTLPSYSQGAMVPQQMYQGPLPPPFNTRPSEHTTMPGMSLQNQQSSHDGNPQLADQQGQQLRPPWPDDGDSFRQDSRR